MTGSGARGRILWVTEESPDRSLGGGSIRQAQLFEALSGAFPVDLLLAGSLADEGVRACAGEVIELPKHPAPWTEQAVARRALELAIALGSPYPSAAYPAARNRRALARALAQRAGAYGLVCVEHEALAPLTAALRGARAHAGTRSLITFHHLVSEMVRQELAATTGRRRRWYRERDLGKARRLERDALHAFDAAVACSPEDAAALGRLAGRGKARAPIHVIPNGVDLDALRVTAVPSEPVVLFPGTLGYAPNVDGALWLCREIWPRVHAAVPEARLVLAGREPVAEVLALSALPGVEVHANVPSMFDYFARARVVLVPLRIGTGTRLKALEALAAGRPVVGTTIGLEGIGVCDGEHALVRDDPEAMADAAVRCLCDDELARSLAAAGRAHVEAGFGWDAIGERLIALAGSLLAPGRVAAGAG